jgi:transposase-like protein
MVTTIHTCAKCGSADIRRNGHSNGHARYQCKACGYQARFVPAAVAKALQYAQVEALSVERNSQRSIARITGVARMTVAKRLKKSSGRFAAAAPATSEKGAAPGMGNPGIG